MWHLHIHTPCSCFVFHSCLLSGSTHSIWQDAVSDLFRLSPPFVLTVYGSFSITCGELAKPRDKKDGRAACCRYQRQGGWPREELLLSCPKYTQ